MIKSISGSLSATEICDDCKTYIRDYTIPTIDAFNSNNVTWEIEDQIVYVTNEIVKCDDCA
tara:strand:+ start:86 stop:268 length:183 start_codon:yes stop_codon:yes gene_type:complete